MSTSRPVNIARILLLVEMAALLISTSMAVGVELLLYAFFAFSGQLRSRLWRSVSQPMVVMLLCWALVLVVAWLYSVGNTSETLGNLTSWRKILLLPMAVAVIDKDIWKQRLVWTLVLTSSLGVVLSFFSWFSGVTLYNYTVGVSVQNHATQGMMFAVSLFASFMCFRFIPPRKNLIRIVVCILMAATFLNLIFITDGRSGYLVLLVLATVTAFSMLEGPKRIVLTALIPILIVGMLAFSPVARERIKIGFDEMRSYQTSAHLTSMGVRVVMWKNTIELIKARPFFGFGTGGFQEAYRRQVEGEKGWQGTAVGDPHNQFLRIIAEQGVFGLLIFLSFIVAIFRQPVTNPYRTLGLGVVLAWCATSMFSAHFSTFAEGRFIYIWCGALMVPTVDGGDDTNTHVAAAEI